MNPPKEKLFDFSLKKREIIKTEIYWYDEWRGIQILR